ncbi:MAG: hypothetical protein NTU80_07205 [Verrucomicrobia bacterium]|nr:hypothetical protein [Verrucomicrobiota bacterium]
MRLSITLEPDLHQIAAARARARRTSISREINDLLRAAITPAQQPAFSARSDTAPALDPSQHTLDPQTGLLISHGRLRFPVSPGRMPITPEIVQQAEYDEDIRHMTPDRPASEPSS